MSTTSKQTLGPYEVVSPIGAGGMGEVFRARDTRLNREVAIKILPKEFASDADRLRRFEQETKTLASLNHPNILTIHDVGIHDGAPYLVSELLEGKTLREELGGSNMALPVRKAMDYAIQVAQGLAAAHSKGVVHRDLKPENIFITQDGRVKILDFGLAKLQPALQSQIANHKSQIDEAAPTLVETTEPGMVLGTPAYMSPEQVRGEPADQRSDIFAFGCVLYEMLSGARAFRRDTPVESMHAVLKEEAPELGGYNPNIPPGLARVVLRCLEKQPDSRFQSARDLAFALSETSPLHLPEHSSLLSGRRRSLAEAWKWAMPAAAIALVLSFALWQPWNKRPGASPATSVSRPKPAAADSHDLLSRARDICAKGSDASRDELKLAISLCQSAIERDRSNAEAWALMARLNCVLYDEYDRTPDLLNAGQSAAQNTLSLAPSSISARLAQASVYALQEATYSQSLDLLRQLERDAPDNPDVLVTLGRRLLFPGASRAVLSGTNNAALKLFDRVLALRPGDPTALNFKAWALNSSGRNAEAHAVWKESIRRTGSPEALVFRFYDLAYNREQPEEAKAVLSQFPPDLVFNDLAVRVVTMFWLAQHEPAKALSFIQPFPRDFLEDHFVEIPKGYLVGRAYAQAGDLAAARLEWRKALEVVNRRLALNPEKPRLINCKASLLSLLGENDEAEKQAEIYQQLTKLDDPETVLVETLSMFMEMGRIQNTVSLIQNNPKIFPATRLRRYAAVYPLVGSSPEFQAELVKVEAQAGQSEKGQPTDTQTGSSFPNTNSVAVLPFVNLSPDKADEYLSDGMTEELLNALSQVEGLRVPGRSSSFAFKEKTDEDLFRKVGEQLHVGAVLEGSVRKAGNQLRITTRLIKVADGFPLWSEEYDRDMTNIFAIQSDIAGRVAEALKVQLLGSVSQAKKPTESLEAYKFYLKGRQLWNRRTGETITQAINCFNQAIAADPAYALAYSGLADCYAILSDYSGAPLREVAPKTRAAALKAIELDNTLGEPHAALGITKANLDWDWPGAEAEFRRAIQLNPNYATTHHWFGNVLGSQKKFEEALAEYQRAQELDPLSDIINAMVPIGLFATGKEELAIQMLQRQIALHSDFEPFHNHLGEFYLLQGRLSEAIHELETALQIDKKNPAEWGLRGFAYARAGRIIDAQRLLGELDIMRRQGQNVTVEMAWIQHGLGNDSQALDSLEQATEDRAIQLPDPLNSPLWKDLRTHPRAQAILRKMNLIK